MWRQRLGLLALAALLAAVGAVPMVDHMTHRVLELVDAVSWAGAFRPIWMPVPIEAWSLRPGAVLLLKGYLALWGPGLPPPAARWLHGFLSLGLLGLGALEWLRRDVEGPIAALAAATSMLLAPSLFSAWYLPELDALGAGAALLGTGLLARPGPLRARLAVLVPALALALFLKESSALVSFALLAVGLLGGADRAARSLRRRSLVALVVGGGVWALMAAPLFLDRRSSMAAVPLLERLPVVEHDAVQLLYLAGVAGVLALVAGSSRWSARLAVGVGLLLPPLVFHSHYETITFSPRWPVTLLALALLGALFFQGRRGRSVLAIYGLVTLAALLAPTAREDIASRVLLAAAPLLHASVLRALSRLPRLPSTGLLALAFFAGPLASAWNQASLWRARNAVDAPARIALAALPELEGRVLFNDEALGLGPQELVAAGAPEALRGRVDFHFVPVWLDAERLPDTGIEEPRLDLEAAWEAGEPTRFLWLAARSEMGPAGEGLRGDLSWARRELGIYSPLFDREGLPRHTRPEDLRLTTYGQEAPLLGLLERRSETLYAEQRRYLLLPLDLLSLPRRLIAGLPLLERYRYEARLFALRAP